MSKRATTIHRSLVAAAITATVGVGLMTSGPATVQADAVSGSALTEANLLQFADLRAATTMPYDDADVGLRGNQMLGDAGRFDEGCLGRMTMRDITDAPDYPATSRRVSTFVDASWTSTRDKETWVNESIAEGRDKASTDDGVRILLNSIRNTKQCQEDPAQGNRYGRARTVKVGTATATYFLDYLSDGSRSGGGVAVIRDGTRFGYVSLMTTPNDPRSAMHDLAVAAAENLR